jgi:uncharacterized protein YecE (DUF72 family)
MSHLTHYATCFNCVEINSSFYRPHRRETYERWSAATGRNFRFSVKIPRSVSHDAALRGSVEELDEFIANVGGLGAKLTVLLLQLPSRMEWQRRVVKRFFGRLRDRIEVPVACEPRHPSWSCASAERLFQEFGISWVYSDPVRVPQSWSVAGRLRYYRMYGSPRVYWSSYTESVLGALATQLKEERKSAPQVWCIFDNTAAGAAWNNAQTLNATLRGSGSSRWRTA